MDVYAMAREHGIVFHYTTKAESRSDTASV